MSAYHATKKHIFILLGKTDILNFTRKIWNQSWTGTS